MDCSPPGSFPSMRFSRQEYWSGLPFPSPEDLPDPGIEPGLPHCRQTLYCWATREALVEGFLSYIKKGKKKSRNLNWGRHFKNLWLVYSTDKRLRKVTLKWTLVERQRVWLQRTKFPSPKIRVTSNQALTIKACSFCSLNYDYDH